MGFTRTHHMLTATQGCLYDEILKHTVVAIYESPANTNKKSTSPEVDFS